MEAWRTASYGRGKAARDTWGAGKRTLLLALAMSLALPLPLLAAGAPASFEAEDPAADPPEEESAPANPLVMLGTIALCTLAVLVITLHARKKR